MKQNSWMLNERINVVLISEFDRLGAELGGKIGLAAWQEILNQVADEKKKISILERAADHMDSTVAIGMKSRCLKLVSLHKSKAVFAD